MQRFGDVLFSGSPFIRWTLLPVLFLSLLVFGFMALQSIIETKLVESVITCLLVLGCLAMIVAMLIPNTTWAIRIVTGLVFAAYSSYVAYEWLFDFDGDIGIGSPRSEANPNNALAGFIVIGLPSLWYTIFGRFTLRKEEVIADESFEDFEDEDEDVETK